MGTQGALADKADLPAQTDGDSFSPILRRCIYERMANRDEFRAKVEKTIVQRQGDHCANQTFLWPTIGSPLRIQ